MAARTRHDPPSRSADGFRRLEDVLNKDPNRFYIFADPNNEDTGVSHYEALGYEVERKRADGPKLIGGLGVSEGDALTRSGQVLMSCPLAAREEAESFAAAKAQAFDDRIRRNGNLEAGEHGRLSWGKNGVDRDATEWVDDARHTPRRSVTNV